jgi:MYXO-CTERM domain-containing protein
MRVTPQLLALALAASAGSALAGTVSMDFEDPVNFGQKLNDPATVGVPAGLTFSNNAWAVGSAFLSCQDNSLFFRAGSCGALLLSTDIYADPKTEETESFTLNVSQGFINSIDFAYSTRSTKTGVPASVTIEVFDALGKSIWLGNKPINNTADCDTGPKFCNWQDISLSFSGVASSVTFTANNELFILDDLKLSTPAGGGVVPEPAGASLALGALVALAATRRRRSR